MSLLRGTNIVTEEYSHCQSFVTPTNIMEELRVCIYISNICVHYILPC
jgi:hypothetical protein